MRLLSTLLLGIAVLSLAATEAAEKPNIVLILCDNLGYGDIEPFGSELHRTPQLNRMAEEGMKLTHFYVSSGVCTPSRASVMTGCYSQRVGLHKVDVDGHVLRPVSPHGLDPEEVTMAEVLKAAGYATTIIGKWHLGDQPEFLPTNQGFDSYYGIPYSDDMTAREWEGRIWPPLPLMEDEKVIEAPADRDTLTRRYTERAVDFMREHRDEPFFLYLPQAMPGSTRTPYSSREFRGRSANGPWGDSVEELDWSTGVILDELIALGIEENTLVLWTSDNGAPNNPGDLKRGTNLPLSGRGYTTAEGGMRVPTIAWWPGTIPAGTTQDGLATTLDLLPTFARLGEGIVPTDRKVDGQDVSVLFTDPNAESPRKTFAYYQLDQLHAVRSGDWKLYLPLEDPQRHPYFRQGPTEPLLFNLTEDIATEHNLAPEHPDVVKRLTEIAEEYRADLGDRDVAGSGQRPVGKTDTVTARVME